MSQDTLLPISPVTYRYIKFDNEIPFREFTKIYSLLPTEIVIFIELVKYNKGLKFNKELTLPDPQFFHPLSKKYLEYCKGAHTAPFLSSTLHEAFLCSCAKNIIFSSCRYGFVLKEIGLQKCLYLISFSAHILYLSIYLFLIF